jgi:hypothetical protein
MLKERKEKIDGAKGAGHHDEGSRWRGSLRMEGLEWVKGLWRAWHDLQ